MAAGDPYVTALAKTTDQSLVNGLRFQEYSFVGPKAYATGGIAGNAASASVVTCSTGLGAALAVLEKDAGELLAVLPTLSNGYILDYDKANDKLKVLYVTSAAKAPMAEIDASTDLSGVTFKVGTLRK